MLNFNTVILPSAARTTTVNSAILKNSEFRGAHFIIDVTAITDTPSVVPTIQGYDAVSGKYYTILTGAAIVATGTTVLKVYPGITAAANLSVSDVLPSDFRVIMTAADTDSMTYSISASFIK